VLEWSAMKMILGLALAVAAMPGVAQQNPSTMQRIGTVDTRFQSYNIEMVEVIGGRFWKPYGSKAVAPPTTSGAPSGIDPGLFEQLTPVDLSNPRLRKLAAALGPAYVRVSGTWANTVYFQDSDAAAPAMPPPGFGGVLTRAEWKGVVDFSKAVDAQIVTSFSTSAGTRDKAGVWTPVEGKKFLHYTESIGGSIAAAEFMNEPTFAAAGGLPAGYDAVAYGRDFAVFQPFFRKVAPKTILLGPGSIGEGIDLVPGGTGMKLLPSKELLAAMGPNPVDAFSYHFYGTVSERCGAAMGGKAGTTPDAALTEDWLGRTGTVEVFYAALRDTYAPGKAMWLTETGQAACGGDRWAATYLDSFRYLDQLGRLAKLGVQVVMHNTLDASDYGLIDAGTLVPRPNYWAAVLWHNTMGTTVLDAGVDPSKTVRVYAQCMKGRKGGVTMLALNLSRTDEQTIALPQDAKRYMLTANDLLGKSVLLNGSELTLATNGDVPALVGVATKRGDLSLPAASITFLTFDRANNPACR
jgi:heparanase 1